QQLRGGVAGGADGGERPAEPDRHVPAGDRHDDLVADGHGAALADQPQGDALQAEEERQRDDERGDPQDRDHPADRGADDDAGRDGADHRDVPRLPDVDEQLGHQGRAEPARHARRQVDLPDQQHEHQAHGEDRDGERLGGQVRDVARAEERLGPQDREQDEQRREADDGRERAEFTGLEPVPVVDHRGLHVVFAAVRREIRVRQFQGGLLAFGDVGGHLVPLQMLSAAVCGARPRSPDRPAVMSSTTWPWVTSVRATSAATRPRYSAVMRSATSNTSFMLWEMSTTPWPVSARRRTRSSTWRVWATPSAAVGSSRITTLDSHSAAL